MRDADPSDWSIARAAYTVLMYKVPFKSGSLVVIFFLALWGWGGEVSFGVGHKDCPVNMFG